MDYILAYQSFLFWFNMYHLFKNFRIDIPSIVHSIITGIGSQLLSPSNTSLPYFALGYSIYDLYTSIQIGNIDLIIHGLSYLSIFSYLIYNELYVPCNIALMMNTSTIFLNLRFAMKRYRYDILKPYYYFFSTFAFSIMFIYYRIILFPIMAMNHLNNFYYYYGDIDLVILITGSSVIMILNLYWLSIIIKKYITFING